MTVQSLTCTLCQVRNLGSTLQFSGGTIQMAESRSNYSAPLIMNVSAPAKHNFPWRRLVPVVLVLLLLGYRYAQPTLKRVTGVNLPTFNDQQNNDRQTGNQNRNSGTSHDYRVNLPAADRNDLKPSRAPGTEKSVSNSGFNLKDLGGNRFESPAGLLYAMGARGEHRIDHVMRHARDMPDRPAHGVFIGGGDQSAVLKIVDDAYRLATSKSPNAKHSKSRGNDAWVVSMGRKVGFDGGQKGKRNGGRSLNSVKLILSDGNRVITAYPVK